MPKNTISLKIAFMLALLGVFTARFGGMAYVIMLIVIWGIINSSIDKTVA